MAASAHPSPDPEDTSAQLRHLLHRVFGHGDFRPRQQPVCEAAAAGRDVLLVMPTGAGKSLCYQLPALARGGTALVISPLIALMDDQASKLSALNLRVARIHSGLSRDDARQACRAYLDGHLDFLFIAPERLRVPGFPEMLAKRKPALIAIDEAHCISQWGHDFRPDYRTLGQFLPALRPSPIIALTATATPTVQQDILRALDLRDPAVFITGFRRDNLHIEIVELSKPQRAPLMRKLLASSANRPAIVYAQSRKAAEEIAGLLGEHFPAAPYHAGLDASTRDRVQRAFLSGKLEVVVATVAFGMGIDKANVRTVIHAALPGSVEAYYQEIGRAGRDGHPSRAILLHSFADRRTQEFLLERNYPSVPEIERVLEAIAAEPASLDALQQQLKMEREVVEQCIDKLLVQGALTADLDGTVCATAPGNWKQSYDQQLRYRRAQIDKIVAYAEGSSCRMTALIRHFGDTNDSGAPCHHCDVCHPQSATASDRHPATPAEKKELRALLAAVPRDGRSVGKVFAELGWSNRRRFQTLVDALAQAGLLLVLKDSFRNGDGEEVTYQKLIVTPEGREADADALSTVWLREDPGDAGAKPRRQGSSRDRKTAGAAPEVCLNAAQNALLDRLKQWRLTRARKTGAPAFTVLHDSVLRAVAAAQPVNLAALGTLRGLGPEKLDRFGAEILALCREEDPAAASPPVDLHPPIVPAPRGEADLSRSTPVQPHGARSYAPPIRPQAQRRIETPAPELTGEQQRLADRLRSWRRDQAAGSGLPTFFILSETALRRVAVVAPQSMEQLETIPELGPDKLARYGAEVLSVCRTG